MLDRLLSQLPASAPRTHVDSSEETWARVWSFLCVNTKKFIIALVLHKVKVEVNPVQSSSLPLNRHSNSNSYYKKKNIFWFGNPQKLNWLTTFHSTDLSLNCRTPPQAVVFESWVTRSESLLHNILFGQASGGATSHLSVAAFRFSLAFRDVERH